MLRIKSIHAECCQCDGTASALIAREGWPLLHVSFAGSLPQLGPMRGSIAVQALAIRHLIKISVASCCSCVLERLRMLHFGRVHVSGRQHTKSDAHQYMQRIAKQQQQAESGANPMMYGKLPCEIIRTAVSAPVAAQGWTAFTATALLEGDRCCTPPQVVSLCASLSAVASSC
jgi:hypothetical protein